MVVLRSARDAALLCLTAAALAAGCDGDGDVPGGSASSSSGTGGGTTSVGGVGGAAGMGGTPGGHGGQGGQGATDVGGSSGGAGGQGGGGCPTNGPPTGTATRRFDVATLHCGSSGSCTGNEDKCFCQDDFMALNVSPMHFMAVGSDMNKANVWAAGNLQAAYVDDLNTNWQAGGAARAAAMIASVQSTFPCGEPKWLIVNEISAGLWPGNAAYRQFVVDFAVAMDGTYDKLVVIASPFPAPGANGASWSQLQAHAYIGAEIYLSGQEVNASGNSVAWCQQQYQAGITAYANRGVPLSRLFLFEHFAQTLAGTGWGRAGVSYAGWHNAITARAQAAHNLGFAGFVSYGWGGNAMHTPEVDRLAFMATYDQQTLP